MDQTPAFRFFYTTNLIFVGLLLLKLVFVFPPLLIVYGLLTICSILVNKSAKHALDWVAVFAMPTMFLVGLPLLVISTILGLKLAAALMP